MIQPDTFSTHTPLLAYHNEPVKPSISSSSLEVTARARRETYFLYSLRLSIGD